MKITQSQLRKIIKEELESALKEAYDRHEDPRAKLVLQTLEGKLARKKELEEMSKTREGEYLLNTRSPAAWMAVNSSYGPERMNWFLNNDPEQLLWQELHQDLPRSIEALSNQYEKITGLEPGRWEELEPGLKETEEPEHPMAAWYREQEAGQNPRTGETPEDVRYRRRREDER